jgi:O-antigen ligase
MARYLPKSTEKNSSFAFFILFLYTISVLIRPHEMFQTSVEWIFIKVLAILCFITVLIEQRPLKITPQHWMLFSLLPLIAISGFFNGSGMYGIEQAQMLIASSVIPLFLFSVCITTIKRQHWIMIICIIAAIVMVHNGHFQQTSDFGAGWAFNTYGVEANDRETEVLRIRYLGFFNDPNDIGMLFVMVIPFIIYFISKGSFLIKCLMLVALFAVGYGIYLTGSRGTQLGAISLIAIYYLVMHAGIKVFIFSAASAPVFAVFLTTLQSNIDESANGRLEAWYAGILMLLSSPLLGIGKGNFIEEHLRTAHNSYILIAAELGIPGYSLWGGALVFTVLTGYLFILKTKSSDSDKISDELKAELSINKTLFFSMIGFMVTAFFLSRTYTVLLFMFLGITIASHIRIQKIAPELFHECFNGKLLFQSILYAWVIIIAVYMSLKIGL